MTGPKQAPFFDPSGGAPLLGGPLQWGVSQKFWTPQNVKITCYFDTYAPYINYNRCQTIIGALIMRLGPIWGLFMPIQGQNHLNLWFSRFGENVEFWDNKAMTAVKATSQVLNTSKRIYTIDHIKSYKITSISGLFHRSGINFRVKLSQFESKNGKFWSKMTHF